ncbi:MAG TPA: hypothetical protein V6C81_21255 [Planktothrix sp.]
MIESVWLTHWVKNDEPYTPPELPLAQMDERDLVEVLKSALREFGPDVSERILQGWVERRRELQALIKKVESVANAGSRAKLLYNLRDVIVLFDSEVFVRSIAKVASKLQNVNVDRCIDVLTHISLHELSDADFAANQAFDQDSGEVFEDKLVYCAWISHCKRSLGDS